MQLPILFEDPYFIVVDKPSGIVVNRAENVSDETVQDWAEKKLQITNYKLQIQNSDFYDRAGIVHRIDKDTSGILIIAKNPASFYQLQSQFATRIVIKRYRALVHGRVVPKISSIHAPVGRIAKNRRKFGVVAEGRDALTSYEVICYYEHSSRFFSLLSVIPHTGRTHQIRIHLKHIGYSIVSDPLYTGRKIYQQDCKWCPRLFLHAAYISFTHPTTGINMKIESPLPNDLKRALKRLEILEISNIKNIN